LSPLTSPAKKAGSKNRRWISNRRRVSGRAAVFLFELSSVATVGSVLIWSARTCPRFGTTRHVASWESGDTSPHSKFRPCPTVWKFDSPPVFGYHPAVFGMSLKLQLDGEAWLAVLADLSQALGKEGAPLRLCLIGSAACLFGGMDGRTSADLDIWKPASDYDRRELQVAAEKAGLLFDPKQTLEPDRPYLQLVEPGLTQLGEFEPVFIERIGRLHLYRPPVENLVAAKLIRAEPKDLGDIQFLVSRHRPDLQRVRGIIARFIQPARERATENLVYLDVLNP
jgi:hypothetical protein